MYSVSDRNLIGYKTKPRFCNFNLSEIYVAFSFLSDVDQNSLKGFFKRRNKKEIYFCPQ